MLLRRTAPWLAYALVTVAASSAPSAEAHYINGYAVGNHRSCGANNLPGCIAELDKFYASTHFPDDAQKNFLWTDARVRATEWAGSKDYFESGETANGFDGVDSALISYIASHGVTQGGLYRALSGSTGNGGCYMRSDTMGLGDNQARYVVLSTCQGLMIGTGDDPTRTGEDPRRTWANPNKGLNCIFGYSNNMADADEYGNYLLEDLATTDDTLAQAFFNASRRITYSNVPAVLCFGTDEANARQHINEAKRFTDERYGRGGSAYSYNKSTKLAGAFELPSAENAKPLARVIKAEPRDLRTDRVAKALLGSDALEVTRTVELNVYRPASGPGVLTYEPRSGHLSWRKGKAALTQAYQLTDDATVRVAADFLQAKGFVESVKKELAATYVVDAGTSVGAAPVVTAKTVVFHQKLNGLSPLNAAGSVEVTVDADGDVTNVSAALLAVGNLRLTEWLDAAQIDLAAARDEALKRLQAKLPDASLQVLETRVGYDVGDYTAVQERARATVEVLLEAEQGGFARRYLEKIPL